MEQCKKFERKDCCDVATKYDIKSYADIDGNVGVSGIDKNYNLEKVMSIAYNHIEKPNIIQKNTNSKWYLKKVPHNLIESKIAEFVSSQRNQGINRFERSTLWIIEWQTDVSDDISNDNNSNDNNVITM